MRLTITSLAALVIPLAAAASKKQICPIKGQQYPIATNLASEKRFQDAVAKIEDTITANLTKAPYNETTFSIGMFSGNDHELLRQYHHTDASVANSTLGTTRADANSIYRIGSISKIVTLYMWLINDGDKKFNHPITDFIPQLAQDEVQQDDYVAPRWDEITVNDLAMFLAGFARDYGFNDVAVPDLVTSELPPKAAAELPDNPENHIDVPARDDPVCGYMTANTSYVRCNQTEYARAASNLAASFPSGYTPMYSNANYALISIALANLVGCNESEILKTSLIDPLRLNDTSLSPPKPGPRSVIPSSDLLGSGWNNALGPLNGAEGAFSTTNDLAAIGRSILNSSLISRSLTRRWYSTTTFVDEIDQAVGRGWEIFRRSVNGHTATLYTKSGDWGSYSSLIFLIPEYDFGFTLLTASTKATGTLTGSLPNTIVNTLLPALDDIAKDHANRTFTGNFTSPTTNSSITVTIDDQPALKLTSYIANGVDLMSTVFAIFGKNIDFRLVPNHLYGGKRVGFTGLYQVPTAPAPENEFYWPCQSWLDVDDFTYASVPLGQMWFDLDEEGKAKTVRLTALRETLERQ